MSKKILITGTLRSGKTTLLSTLQKNTDIVVVPEAAQDIIDRHGYEITQNPAFQEMVFAEQLQREAAAEALNQNIILCDRGTLDNIAFCRVIGVKIQPQWMELLFNRYDAALILNQNDINFDPSEYSGSVNFDMADYRNRVDSAIRQVVHEVGLPVVEISGTHETRVKTVREFLTAISTAEGNLQSREGSDKPRFRRKES